LRDEKRYTMKEIAQLVRRKLPTIYTTYRAAKRKYKGGMDVSDVSVVVPVSVVVSPYSVLESIVGYLRSERYTVRQIAAFLGKSLSTVKTVLRRYKMKGGKL
jgi:DNA-directed RNA polymerase specialized sigma24 family protein